MQRGFLTTATAKKAAAICGIVAAIIGCLLIAHFYGGPLIEFVTDHELLHRWVEEKGVYAHLGFLCIMALQVIVAIIPGEPLEIGAGYVFGTGMGTFLCLLGALLGSIVIFVIVQTIGMPMVKVFFKEEDIDKISFLKNTEKLKMMLFFIFLIPGTPKDMLSYFVGLTKIKLASWLAISTVARIPSVITSTIGGSALGSQNYFAAAMVFVVTAVVSLGGMLLYKRIINKNQEER